ncbi:uncharacterized protein LOC122500992 [Leptopilina heterotoma]|uniref:uncharacterized protein LOC122500992 n=1 Tax=Leptopilina heterotoma TaxID=63436 RepID=UPI001CA85331|nr:uncharacterized protein LOC122500992 [Leptopilina heterotoma]XP_043466122.1 uncharacterized protein LOC122500992 [Leptopilina heterotoma]
MKKELVLLCIISLIVVGFGKPCKYWCKTDKWEYYCCSSKSEKSREENPLKSMMGILIPHLWFALGFPKIYHHEHIAWEEMKHQEHGRKCPPVRHACPRSNDWWYDAPIPCYNDDECISSAKCCFDICLNHKTCKPTV